MSTPADKILRVLNDRKGFGDWFGNIAVDLQEEIKKALNKAVALPSPEDACDLVERHCRALGGDVQVIFTAGGVEIAPLADAGSTTGTNLYEAIKEAANRECES